jgi:hypothetical protein
MLAKLDNNKTETVVNALIKQARKLPTELYKSLTWDRGSEMTGHQKFTLETDIQVYFCDPQSPWESRRHYFCIANVETSDCGRHALYKAFLMNGHSRQSFQIE